MSSKISFKDLYFLSTHGLSTREIGEMSGLSRSCIGYQQNKYGLNTIRTTKYPHEKPNYFFNKIDTPEKAYVLGFLLADGHINKKNKVSVATCIDDKEVIEFIASVLDSNVRNDYKFDKKTRRFPHCETQRVIKDIVKFSGGRLKKERHYPRVRKDLERYLLLGFFDADGCITWGIRKDRNRIWQKVMFASSYSLLEGVQQHLFNIGITTKLRPKANEDCYIIEFANKKDVLKFLDYIYPNDEFIILQRKYLKAQALRLELEEFGGNTKK